MLQHADHIRLAIVYERVEVAWVLRETTDVDCFQGTGSADTEFVWAESDDGAVVLVEGVDGASAGTGSSLGLDP